MTRIPRLRSLVHGIIVALALAACQDTDAPQQPHTSLSLTSADVVDSTLSREETMTRFRVGLDSVGELAGGAESPADLIRRYVAAIGSRDTLALGELVMTKPEFAWLYYPTTPQGLPPYDLPPNLLWFLVEGRGTQGLTRASRVLAGKQLEYRGHRCNPQPSVEGANRLWGPCEVIIRVDGGTASSLPLVGLIIERSGRYKFLNYANNLGR